MNIAPLQGFNAIRFTMADGDLSTLEGQAKLWSVINKHQPLHIWVAPECGPWSGWNHLNMYKSIHLFDQVCKKRREQLKHIELCSQLCRFQSARKRHFHLEEPLGSGMIHTAAFQSISQQTTRNVVDMCVFLVSRFQRPIVFCERPVKSFPLILRCVDRFRASVVVATTIIS